MNHSVQQANMFDPASYVPAVLQDPGDYRSEIYEQNRHRVYALAFWMTGSELAAEELMTHTFCRAFTDSVVPGADDIDTALVTELRECTSLATLTLDCAPCNRVLSVRRNTLRVELERAVIQLPGTEKMIFLLHDVESYNHSRIARLLGISEEESCRGLHQARLRLRELLAH